MELILYMVFIFPYNSYFMGILRLPTYFFQHNDCVSFTYPNSDQRCYCSQAAVVVRLRVIQMGL